MTLKPQDNQLKRAICLANGQQVFKNVAGPIDAYVLQPLKTLASLKAGDVIIVHSGVEYVRAAVKKDTAGSFYWQIGDEVGFLAFENGFWVTTSRGEVASA